MSNRYTIHRRNTLRFTTLILFLVLDVGSPRFVLKSVQAHEGPPYPVIMDEAHGPFSVSIWADPDIGEALFYIALESTSKESELVEPKVTFWTQPVGKRLERVNYDAERQSLRNRVQFLVKAHFDKQDMWNVGFMLTPPTGQTTEINFEIESTPDGYGAWDLVIYLFPFLFLGGLWIRALLRGRSANPALGATHNEHGSSAIETNGNSVN